VEAQQGYALITFSDILSAFFAQQSLNNFFLNKYHATLSVKWIIKKQQQPQNTTTVAPEEESISNQENIMQ
jgi:hypothetical protein